MHGYIRITLPRKPFSRMAYIENYLSKFDGVKIIESSRDRLLVEFNGIQFLFERDRKLLLFVMKNGQVFYFRAFNKYFELCKWLIQVFPPSEDLMNHKVVEYANRCQKRYPISWDRLYAQSLSVPSGVRYEYEVSSQHSSQVEQIE